MTDVQRRVLRIAAWIGALAGTPILVLVFVMRWYSYRFHQEAVPRVGETRGPRSLGRAGYSQLANYRTFEPAAFLCRCREGLP